MRSEIIRELQTEYEQLRSRNQQEEQKRLAQAAQTSPLLAGLLERRQELIWRGMRGILSGTQAAQDIPAQMQQLNDQIRAALAAHHLPQDYLEPVYRCPICRDTGYVGEPIRDMCACMRRQLNQRLYQSIVGAGAGETFESWNALLYSDIPDDKGHSPRQFMEDARKDCEAWAIHYPENAQQNVLLMGDSGLGKTFMMHAMARVLIDRGYNIMMLSAYQLLEAARKAYFDNEEAALTDAMNADVLFIDDLGSEPIMRNVTVEQLYHILNERQAKGQGTVISTNLKKKALQDQYTERIVSRLWDDSSCLRVIFVGTDLRKAKEQA